jgi:hypothetical protein
MLARLQVQDAQIIWCPEFFQQDNVPVERLLGAWNRVIVSVEVICILQILID